MIASALRILVVDDDEVDRRACRRALMKAGAKVPALAEAGNAAEALALGREHSFDCLLLDYRLPDMDGLAVLAQWPHPGDDAPTPVVMLTGADDVAIAVEAMRCGASDYLVKDVQGRYQTLLPAVVQRALRERELRREKQRSEQALERYRQQLQRLTQQLMAQEKATTRRIAQSLHDRLGQTLAAIRFMFDAIEAAPSHERVATYEREAVRIGGLVDQAVREVRQALVDLRPPLLDEAGLVAALDNELRGRSGAGAELNLLLDAAPDCRTLRWPADVEYAAFMVAREALANALRHARAAMLCVRVAGSASQLRLEVEDDGIGIDETALHGRPGHLGMVGMRERALVIGAHFTVQRNPDRGTTVRLLWEDGA